MMAKRLSTLVVCGDFAGRRGTAPVAVRAALLALTRPRRSSQFMCMDTSDSQESRSWAQDCARVVFLCYALLSRSPSRIATVTENEFDMNCLNGNGSTSGGVG